MKEALIWKSTQNLLKNDHHQKGTKINLLDCRLQFTKAYQLLRLNGNGFDEHFH